MTSATDQRQAFPGAAAAPVATPPETGTHSQESERMVISLMLNPVRIEVHHKLMQLLAPDDFYIDQNKALWQIIATLRDAGVAADPVAVIDHAATHNDFVGGATYVIDVVNDPIAKVCTDEAALAAAGRVKGFAMSRRLQRCLATGVTLCMAGQSFEQVISYVQDDLINLRGSATTSRAGPQQIGVFYDAIMAQYEAKEKGIDTNDCVPTGYLDLDDLLGGGLPREAVTILAGRPSMGKSAFAGDIEQNIAARGTPTLTFSLEMPGKQNAQRNLSRHSRIPFQRVRTGDFHEDDFNRLVDSIGFLSKVPSYIDESPGLTISEIRSRARAFAQVFPDLVVVVDYMQEIRSPNNSKADLRQVVTDASRGLLQLARELKCPVVALAQLNRSLESRANRRPVLSDLKESGQIEQDAGIILFLYRDEWYNPDTPEPGITEIICGKNRGGATGTVKFAHSLETMTYREIVRNGRPYC